MGKSMTEQHPRAWNARKHGLAVAAQYEPSTTRAMLDLVVRIAGSPSGERRIRAAHRLVETFFEVRRCGKAKLRVLEEAAASVGSAGDASYARAYCQALSTLTTLEGYERRAESQFFSASREYAKLENMEGIGLADR
jgi:hypothetical protein